MAWFVLPETKNIPLEEMAKLFGEDVVVFAQDLHYDPTTHELVVDDHGNRQIHKVATEVYESGETTDIEKETATQGHAIEHVAKVGKNP